MDIALSCLMMQFDKLGGLQNRVKNLILGLCDRGNNVKLIQTQIAYENSKLFYKEVRDNELEALIIPDTNFRHYNILDTIRVNGFDIFDYIKNIHLDIIDTYDPYFNIPCNHIPIVYSTNYSVPYLIDQIYYAQIRQSTFHLIKTIIEIKILMKANSIIVENINQKTWLNKYFRLPAGKIHVILPGYDKELVKNCSMFAAKGTKRNQKIKILFTGRMTRLKGIFELLIAFGRILDYCRDIELWYVGTGPDEKKLKYLCNNLEINKNVVFFGERNHSETLEIIAKSDIVVLPSYNEGVPLSIMEAMSLGRSTIASDVGGISAHLIEDQINGILIKPKQTKNLEDSLIKLIENHKLREKFGNISRRKIDIYTNEYMIEKTLKVYERTISDNLYE